MVLLTVESDKRMDKNSVSQLHFLITTEEIKSTSHSVELKQKLRSIIEHGDNWPSAKPHPFVMLVVSMEPTL